MQPQETGILILAAGASKRLGRPKQELLFHGKTLLDHMIATACALKTGPVVVVGSGAASKETEQVDWVINQQWQEGMAGSIHCGIKEVKKKYPAIETVIITVCDQPFVSVELLKEMIEVYQQTKKPMVACVYAEIIGTPALFHQSVFSELLELSGDKGARQLLNKDKQRVGLVNFPLGAIDIDTEEDYERLLKQ